MDRHPPPFAWQSTARRASEHAPAKCHSKISDNSSREGSGRSFFPRATTTSRRVRPAVRRSGPGPRKPKDADRIRRKETKEEPKPRRKPYANAPTDRQTVRLIIHIM